MIHKCPECDTLVSRLNKIYCSTGCKQKGYRIRQAKKVTITG